MGDSTWRLRGLIVRIIYAVLSSNIVKGGGVKIWEGETRGVDTSVKEDNGAMEQGSGPSESGKGCCRDIPGQIYRWGRTCHNIQLHGGT